MAVAVAKRRQPGAANKRKAKPKKTVAKKVRTGSSGKPTKRAARQTSRKKTTNEVLADFIYTHLIDARYCNAAWKQLYRRVG